MMTKLSASGVLGIATVLLTACSGNIASVGSVDQADTNDGMVNGGSGAAPASSGGATCLPYTRLEPADAAYGGAGDRPSDYAMGPLAPGLFGIASKASFTPGFGTWMTETPSTPFAGHRVRLRATVFAEGIAAPSWAGLWLRADDAARNAVAFDNMEDRPIVSGHLAPRDVVLDIPTSATELAFGTLLKGKGNVKVTKMSLATADEASFIADARDWYAAGDNPAAYTMEVNHGVAHCSRPGAHIASKPEAVAQKFGTFMDMIDARAYRGKRVRLTGAARTANVAGSAGIWLRVDSPTQQELDNMSNRPVTGTSPLTDHVAVLDVPADATNIAFGALVVGAGELWLDRATIEIVDASVPTTGIYKGPLGTP